MRILRPVSEAEMVACFLRAELDSPRFRDQLLVLLAGDGQDASLVTQPRVGNPSEDAYRESLLDRHRAWTRREGLFSGFPRQVDWFRAALTPDEVLAIFYINWDWWLRVSGGTRRPVDAARRIREGAIRGSTTEDHEPIAAKLREGEGRELIAVAPPDHSKLVLVEGHVRLTAYALYPQALPDEMEILLGISDEIELWSEF
jgi:hypothetical protein